MYSWRPHSFISNLCIQLWKISDLFLMVKNIKRLHGMDSTTLLTGLKGASPPDISKLKFNYIDMWDIRIDAVLKRFIKNYISSTSIALSILLQSNNFHDDWKDSWSMKFRQTKFLPSKHMIISSQQFLVIIDRRNFKIRNWKYLFTSDIWYMSKCHSIWC